MKTLQTMVLAVGAVALVGLGACKNAEKKRRQGGDENAAKDPGKAAQGPTGATASKPPPATGPTSPHGGSPHAGPGPVGMAGGKVAAGTTGADGKKAMGPMTVVVPKSWKESPPSSGMRLAQWSIGETDPAELVAYHFPGGGSVDANLDRWYGQFKQADGSSSKDKASRKDETIGGLPVTTVSVKGHYVAAMTPGQAAKHDKADHQMLAAIITTDKGPIFLKMIGPAKTVTAAEGEWATMIKSIAKTP